SPQQPGATPDPVVARAPTGVKPASATASSIAGPDFRHDIIMSPLDTAASHHRKPSELARLRPRVGPETPL
ncbi:MAG: hypothetical protein ACRDRL_10335, partial [Sciscionella sp.]